MGTQIGADGERYPTGSAPTSYSPRNVRNRLTAVEGTAIESWSQPYAEMIAGNGYADGEANVICGFVVPETWETFDNMQRIYSTVTIAVTLSNGSVDYQFEGVDDPEEATFTDILNALASECWTVDGFVGTTVINGVQYTTVVMSKPSPDLIDALGRTWR